MPCSQSIHGPRGGEEERAKILLYTFHPDTHRLFPAVGFLPVKLAVVTHLPLVVTVLLDGIKMYNL